MPLSYESPLLNTANAEYDGPILYEYPFAEQGDLTHFVARQKYRQIAESYAPPTLSVASTLKAVSAYSVGDGAPTLADAGLVEFSRRWATIPASRTVPRGTYAFLFPAVPAVPVGATKTITAVSGNVYTSTAHGYSVGSYIIISLVYSGGSVTARGRLTAVTTNTFTITLAFVPSGTFTSGTAQLAGAGRSVAKSVPSTSIEVFSYALPGVTSGITTVQDFRADPIFKVVDATTGDDVDYVGAGTSPTESEYVAMISAGSYVVAESEVRLYMGQILERRTLMVAAA